MSTDAKVSFFDSIAGKWDGWEDLDRLAARLAAGLDALGVGPDETVLDVGCGTGNLTRALLARLSDRGRVVAIDFSEAMVARAKQKICDDRVAWNVTDAMRLPLSDEAVDRVICYSVWPHFDDPGAAARELGRVLRARGALHVWHLASREKINEIHASAGAAVSADVLAPAVQTASLLEGCGLSPFAVVDDDSGYLVSALKGEQPG